MRNKNLLHLSSSEHKVNRVNRLRKQISSQLRSQGDQPRAQANRGGTAQSTPPKSPNNAFAAVAAASPVTKATTASAAASGQGSTGSRTPNSGASKPATGSGAAGIVAAGASTTNKATAETFSVPTPGAAVRPKADSNFSEPDGKAPIAPKGAPAASSSGTAGDNNAPSEGLQAVPGLASNSVSGIGNDAQGQVRTKMKAGQVVASDVPVKAKGVSAGSLAPVAAPAQGLVAQQAVP